MNAEDVLTSTFVNCGWRDNVRGFDFTYSSDTGTGPAHTGAAAPNALTFLGCNVARNTTYGGLIEASPSLVWQGGSVEGNGSDQNNDFGLKLLNPQGSASIIGVHAEFNKGKADFWVKMTSNTAAGLEDATYRGVVNFIGCYLLRFADRHVINNILFDVDTNRLLGNVIGNTFIGLTGYTPSATRKYIGVSDPHDIFTLAEGGFNYWHSEALEKPDFSGKPYVSNQHRVTSAVSIIGATGAATGPFNAWPARTGTGVYTVTFGRAMDNATYKVEVTPVGSRGFHEVTAKTTLGFTVKTYDTANAAADRDVDVLVHGGMTG
jgi:hypothetical protein